MMANMITGALSSSWRRFVFAAFAAAPMAVGAVVAGPSTPTVIPASTIQSLIDAATEGAVVVVPPGHYLGKVAVEKPLTLDGDGKVTIDAGGTGSVMLVKANNVTIKGFHLTGTGSDHNSEDAGIQVRGNNNVLKDNRIDDALFGIDLQQSYFNVIRRNHITSKQMDLGLRGDSIRLWYSDDNAIEDNVVKDSRDFVLWYSKRNRVTGNHSSGGRYGMHFMFAADNLVENNTFTDNSVGISMMYDQGDIVRGNVISHSVGATGTCISLKEASAVLIENNEIIYCANGIFLDVSPFQPDTVNTITNNRIAFNDIAISFLNDWQGNEFKTNTLTANMTEVAVFGGGSAKRNVWDGNAWDSYEGFDRDGDGIGDTPHRVLNYAGRVWMDVPNTRFFKGAPVLEVLDFLDRLAPFSEPELMLEDEHPRLAVKTEKKNHEPVPQTAAAARPCDARGAAPFPAFAAAGRHGRGGRDGRLAAHGARRRPAPAPARGHRRKRLFGRLHQMRPMRPGLPGRSHRPGRHRRRFRHRRALSGWPGPGLRFFLRRGAMHPGLSHRRPDARAFEKGRGAYGAGPAGQARCLSSPPRPGLQGSGARRRFPRPAPL